MKKQSFRYLILNFSLLTILFTITSCENIDLKRADTDVPVIEGYISPNNTISVKILKQLVFDSKDTVSQYLNNLNVKIYDDEVSYKLINTSDGLYTSEIEVMENKAYSLEFEYNNKLVSSETYVPTKPENFSLSATTMQAFSLDNFTPGSSSGFERPEPITISWSNPESEYHIVVVECLETNPTLINQDADRPMRSFRNSPVNGTSSEINPMSFFYYGKHQVILYKLNSEYAALYEKLGTSSLDITAPPSNIINGLGIFTGVNTDTLFLNITAK